MKNIHLIPTDKPSRLHLGDSGLVLCDLNFGRNTINGQNIYITSDEEIKEGDKDFYIIANDRDKTWINHIEKVIECKIDPIHGKVLIFSSGFLWIDEGQKIILTTDQDLIADGVQAIDDEFLEWFVKNPGCVEVEVIKNYLSNNGQWKDVLLPSEWEIDTKIKYKIIIPQEEPKQLTDLEIAIKLEEIEREGSKQEMIEKAAERMYPINSTGGVMEMLNKHQLNNSYKQEGFIAGAKSDAVKDYWYKKFWEVLGRL
jgi:hypothetical protein